MKKSYFKFSLALNIIVACLAVIFSLVYYYYSSRVDDGESFLTFLFYVKTFFDLLAVFIGYTTVIYAFSQFDFYNGIISLGTFSVSFLISFVFQVVGTCMTLPTEFSASVLVYTIFYSFGQGFITQMIPALIIALIAYKITKDKNESISSFFSLKNSTSKAIFVITMAVFGLNVLSHTGFSVLPGLISEMSDYGSITQAHFNEIIISYVEVVIFYLVMQYLIYYFVYKIYDNYVTEHKEKKVKVK